MMVVDVCHVSHLTTKMMHFLIIRQQSVRAPLGQVLVISILVLVACQ